MKYIPLVVSMIALTACAGVQEAAKLLPEYEELLNVFLVPQNYEIRQIAPDNTFLR